MKDQHFGDYTFTCHRFRFRRKGVMPLLAQTYWAKMRKWSTVRRSIRGAIPFGVFDAHGKQVGFARVVTDCSTTYYLADVVIDESLRGKGVGIAFLRYILSDPRFNTRRGMLLTQTAHGFYEHEGFQRFGERLMMREPTDRT